jgi:GT2 family glycosyltransferase
VVAYTDDDVLLHPRWLERLVQAFDRPDIQSVTGLVLPAELATDAQIHFERHWGFGRGFRRIDFDRAFFDEDRRFGPPVWSIGAGASMALRRSVFASIGYFDERLDVGAAGCSGDSEFWHRILASGGTCRYEPSAVAFHVHRATMPGLRKQIYFYMRGHAAALMVQAERSKDRRSFWRAVIMMPRYYGRRLLRRLVRMRDEDLMLGTEISGYISGLLFYLRTRRMRGQD